MNSIKKLALSLLLVGLLACPALAEVGGQAGVGKYTGSIGMTGNSGDGSDFIGSVRLNGRNTPLAFAGADLCAKIQAVENWCALNQTLNTCNIDATAAYLIRTSTCTSKITFSKPTNLVLSGNLDYVGAGSATGSALEFALGSDGSTVSCEPSALDEQDTYYNYGEGGAANFTKQVGCSITAELSSVTGQPVIGIDPLVSRVYLHDLNVQGDASVGDGLYNNGADGTTVQRVSFTHERPGGVASNPTGWAINNVSNLPQNALVLRDNLVVGWGTGLRITQSAAASDIGVQVISNIFVLMGGQELFVDHLQVSRFISNQFLSMFPATDNVKKLEFGTGINQNILFQNNHSECDNQTHKAGIIELAIDAGTYRSNNFVNNSLHGNSCGTNDATYDPNYLVYWGAVNGWGNGFRGNDLAGSLHGGFNIVANAPVSLTQNHVAAPFYTEAVCAAQPGPGDGCLLIAGSQLPTLGDPMAPLHMNGTIGAWVGGSNTLVSACVTLPVSGAFSQLTFVTDLNGSTCGTAPRYNVRNNTQGLLGSGLTAGTTSGVATQAQTLTFSAGDQVCLVRTTAGASCTTPVFSVDAQALRID